MTTDLGDGSLGPAEAYAALERYAGRYGQLPLRLLIHAAVPQGYRADLLNLIKMNFLPEAGSDLSVDADVLFSSLSEGMGGGFYRLDQEVRGQCLMLLDAAFKHGRERRSISVARFLLAYVTQAERSPRSAEDPLLSEFLATQSWVATSFIDPRDTARRFAQALEGVGARGQTVESGRDGRGAFSTTRRLSRAPGLCAWSGRVASWRRSGGQAAVGVIGRDRRDRRNRAAARAGLASA